MERAPGVVREALDAMRTWSARRFVVFGVVIVLVVGGVTAVVAIYVNSGPAAAVTRFLTAVKDRDVTAALAEVESGSIEGDDAFLTKKAIRTDWTFDSVGENEPDEPSTAGEHIAANITGFGKTEEAVFDVVKTEGSWKLEDPFSYVTFSATPLTYVDVNGSRLADPDANAMSHRTSLPVFPGAAHFYQSLPEDADVAKPGSLSRVMAPRPSQDADSGYTYNVDLGELTLTGDLLDKGRKQVDALLGACVETTVAAPALDEPDICPFKLDASFEEDGYTYRVGGDDHVSWVMSTQPTVDLVDYRGDDEDAAHAGFRTSAGKPGTLTVLGSAEGSSQAAGDRDFVIECEYSAANIRGQLTMKDSFTMGAAAEADDEPFAVGPENDACTLSG